MIYDTIIKGFKALVGFLFLLCYVLATPIIAIIDPTFFDEELDLD